MDEHLDLLDLAGDVRRNLAAGDRQTAMVALRQLTDLLDLHVRREEAGVFAALKIDGDYADAVTELETEHQDLDAAIAALDLTAPDLSVHVDGLLNDLALHIDKENLGVFPVAVVTLGSAGWELVSRAEKDQCRRSRDLGPMSEVVEFGDPGLRDDGASPTLARARET